MLENVSREDQIEINSDEDLREELWPRRKKIMIIYFEKQEDRDRIKHLFTVRAAKRPAPGIPATPPPKQAA